MLVYRVMWSDILRCNSSDKYDGCPVVSARCVSIAILYFMSCATGSQWRDLNNDSADERLGTISVIRAWLFWTLCNFCTFLCRDSVQHRVAVVQSRFYDSTQDGLSWICRKIWMDLSKRPDLSSHPPFSLEAYQSFLDDKSNQSGNRLIWRSRIYEYFTPVSRIQITIINIISFIMLCSNKQCTLDTLPTWLIKDSLVYIFNLYLQHFSFYGQISVCLEACDSHTTT